MTFPIFSLKHNGLWRNKNTNNIDIYIYIFIRNIKYSSFIIYLNKQSLHFTLHIFSGLERESYGLPSVELFEQLIRVAPKQK